MNKKEHVKHAEYCKGSSVNDFVKYRSHNIFRESVISSEKTSLMKDSRLRVGSELY